MNLSELSLGAPRRGLAPGNIFYSLHQVREPLSSVRTLFFAALVMVLSVGLAFAQATGSVEGTVRDATGAAVVGARVELMVAGQTRAAVTDASGHYRFEAVPPGTHRLVAAQAGLAPAAADAIVADVAAFVDLTFGSVVTSENVSVTGVAPGARLDRPAAAASRLGLTPRETPATVNVITFAETQERGLATTTEALTRAPGVLASNIPATFATSMRGFTAQAVSTLFDGTRSTTSTMVMRAFDSWNFERIEVLKGPASVLYGEGALAGAINFVTKKPDFINRRSDALVSIGTLGAARAAVGTTGPVGSGERAAYRVDVVTSRNGGFIDDTPMNTVTLSGTVDVKVTPAATLSLSVDHFRDDYSSAYWGTPLIGPSVARDASDIVTDSRGYVLDRAARSVNYEATDAITRSHNTWLRARLDWRLAGNWRLSNEAYGYHALREWEGFDTYGFDATRGLVTRASTAITHDHDFFGNRLTLSSDRRFGSRRNRLSVGVETNTNHFFMPRRFGTTTSVDPFAPVRGEFPALTTANFPGAGNYVDFTTDLNLFSVFAEEAFNVAPRVNLVGGLRYDHFNVERTVNDANAGTLTEFGRVFEPKSGRVGAVIDLVAATQAFVQFTSAVAPVSTVPIISQTNARFELTTGKSWEAGLKSTLAGGRAEMTASAFKVSQDNILTRDPNNPNITVQGGRQSSTGVEISVSASPTPSLRIDANATILDAKFDELVEAGGLNRAGNTPINVPERSAGVWASYRFSGKPLTLGVGVRGQGRFFGNNANSLRLRGFALLDAQASWHVGRGDLTVRGKNLTDSFYAEWALTANQIVTGAPRTAEVSYQFRF